MKKQTVPAQACHMFVDSGWGDVQLPGDLPVGHAPSDLHEDLDIKIRPLLPVGCGECLAAEGPLAVKARKPLDTVWWDVSSVEPGPFKLPARMQSTVELAVRIWAVGWCPGFLSCLHTPEGQGSNQQHFRRHNLVF